MKKFSRVKGHLRSMPKDCHKTGMGYKKKSPISAKGVKKVLG